MGVDLEGRDRPDQAGQLGLVVAQIEDAALCGQLGLRGQLHQIRRLILIVLITVYGQQKFMLHRRPPGPE